MNTRKPTILSITLDQCAEVIGTIVTEFTKEKSKAALYKTGSVLGELKPKELRSEESESLKSRLEESKSQGNKPEESKLEESKLKNSAPDDSAPDNSVQDDSALDESKAVESKAVESKADESKADESKLDETNLDETNLDESKPEASKREDSDSEESEAEASVSKDREQGESESNQTVTLCGNNEVKQGMIEADLENNENRTSDDMEISSIPNSEMKKNQHEEVSTTISGLSEVTNPPIADEECVKIPDEVTTLPIPEEDEVSPELCDLAQEDDKQIQCKANDFAFETSEIASGNAVHYSSEVDEKVVTSDQSVTSENSEDWDIVDGDELQMKADEQLARAAQMVGSALFHSDMSRSAEALDARADMDSILSSPESIGSLPTITSERNEVFMMKKWGEEINQLRELGFVDDQKTIEVLEALQAINVGDAVNAKVTVADAIDQLLS